MVPSGVHILRRPEGGATEIGPVQSAHFGAARGATEIGPARGTHFEAAGGGATKIGPVRNALFIFIETYNYMISISLHQIRKYSYIDYGLYHVGVLPKLLTRCYISIVPVESY